MSIAATLTLEPLEWAIVCALREHGTLTVVALMADLAERGYTPALPSLRTRLATLQRFCVVVRADVGPRRGNAVVAEYRLCESPQLR